MVAKGSVLTQRRRGIRTVRQREALHNVISDSFSGEWGDECTSQNGVQVLRTVNFRNDGSISYEKTVRRLIKASKIEAKKLCAGDIIVEKSGGTKDNPVGRVVYFDRADEIFLTNNFTQVLRPDNKIVFPRYLFYVLLALYKMKVTESLYNKTTGIQNLQMSKYLELQVPVYSLPEQKRIAAVLDKICELKKNAEAQIANLDLLVKSRFVEMFGTLSERRFEQCSLGTLCEFIKDGTHQTPTYTNDIINGYKFLSSKDVVGGTIDWTRIKYIPKELHDELYSRLAPRRNDILLAKNGTTGIAALVDTDDVFDIYVSLALLRFGSGIDMKYVFWAINSPDTKRQFDASLKGVGVPNLHLGEIKKTMISLPPLALQQEFAVFVEKVEKLKDVAKKSVEEMDTLYRAKLQEYFG